MNTSGTYKGAEQYTKEEVQTSLEWKARADAIAQKRGYDSFDDFLEGTYQETCEAAKLIYGEELDQLSDRERHMVYDYMADVEDPRWKRISYKGTKTNYIVSNTGLVKNVKTKQILKGSLSNSSPGFYPMVTIYVPGDSTPHPTSVHSLVAKAFLPNPNHLPRVRHIGPNRSCNWYRNLQWYSPKWYKH